VDQVWRRPLRALYSTFLYKSKQKSVGYRIFVLHKASLRIKEMIEMAVFLRNGSMYSINPYVPHEHYFM
jgi:hypothetical protein